MTSIINFSKLRDRYEATESVYERECLLRDVLYGVIIASSQKDIIAELNDHDYCFKFDWTVLSGHRRLSLSFIDETWDSLPWSVEHIFARDDVTFEFVMRHISAVCVHLDLEMERPADYACPSCRGRGITCGLSYNVFKNLEWDDTLVLIRYIYDEFVREQMTLMQYLSRFTKRAYNMITKLLPWPQPRTLPWPWTLPSDGTWQTAVDQWVRHIRQELSSNCDIEMILDHADGIELEVTDDRGEPSVVAIRWNLKKIVTSNGSVTVKHMLREPRLLDVSEYIRSFAIKKERNARATHSTMLRGLRLDMITTLYAGWDNQVILLKLRESQYPLSIPLAYAKIMLPLSDHQRLSRLVPEAYYSCKMWLGVVNERFMHYDDILNTWAALGFHDAPDVSIYDMMLKNRIDHTKLDTPLTIALIMSGAKGQMFRLSKQQVIKAIDGDLLNYVDDDTVRKFLRTDCESNVLAVKKPMRTVVSKLSVVSPGRGRFMAEAVTDELDMI
jgi:hypothetical protein